MMSNPEKAIEFYASLNYGHVILVDPPIHDENRYVANLRSDYPLYIRNEKPPQTRTLHIFEIESLGQITSDENGKIIKDMTTSRDECIRNIQSFFELWKKRAEEIVVYATSDRLVNFLSGVPFLLLLGKSSPNSGSMNALRSMKSTTTAIRQDEKRLNYIWLCLKGSRW